MTNTNKYYDNTRVSSYRSCPRSFFFRHVKHWEPVRKSAALIFGGAWHEGMDEIWTKLVEQPDIDTIELSKLALKAFMGKWIEEGFPALDEIGPEEEQMIGFRHPMTALEMYIEYIDQRRGYITDPRFKLLAVEKPFAVPLDPDDPTLFYVGRLDKVFQRGRDVYVGEHKTTTAFRKDGGFMSTFLDSFSPNSQIDGYTFAAHIEYGDAVTGVMVDAALVHKNHHDIFRFIPIERQFSQIEGWLWETHYHIDQIEQNKEAFKQCDPDASYMPAFPKNTQSCAMYGRCPYASVCKMWPNPAGKDTPPGFHVNKWSPFKTLELEKIGLSEEVDDE